jgi:hypothetical protein
MLAASGRVLVVKLEGIERDGTIRRNQIPAFREFQE